MERTGPTPVDAAVAILKGRSDRDTQAGETLKAIQDETAKIDGPVGKMASLLNRLREVDEQTEDIIQIEHAAFHRDGADKSLEDTTLELPDGSQIRATRAHVVDSTDVTKCYEGMTMVFDNSNKKGGRTLGIRIDRVQNGDWQFFTAQEKTTTNPGVQPADEYRWVPSDEAQVNNILTDIFPE